MERYIACMFIGHGQFMTQYNQHGVEELVPIHASPLEVSICTFAPPGEGCFYPPDMLINLKNKLVNYSSSIEKFDRSFTDVIKSAQRETLGTTYSSPDWSPYFNKRPEFSEKCIKSNSYFEKEFSSDEKLGCGIYIIKNNVMLPNNMYIPFDDPQYQIQTLSGIINFFKDFYINNLFILDATCSIFVNPEHDARIDDERTIRRLRQDLVAIPRLGGRKKNKYSKKKRTRKNKTRKSFFKRKHT